MWVGRLTRTRSRFALDWRSRADGTFWPSDETSEPTGASIGYEKTGNLRTVQISLGYIKIEGAVRYPVMSAGTMPKARKPAEV